LLIGFSSGVGGLGVGLLGRVADAYGLIPTVWALVAVAALAYGLTFALPKTRPATHFMPDMAAPELSRGS